MMFSFRGVLRDDASSHLFVHPFTFEVFLFLYLTTALCVQNLNIYKTNFYLVDTSLILFVLLLLSRRLTWCVFQEIQKRLKCLGWSSRYLFMAVCINGLVGFAIWKLIQQTSIFNILFLFYPVLLYCSLFGFTMEPRPLRDRYKPPNRFLQHINMSGRPGVISELLSNTSGMTDDTVTSLTALSNELQSLLLPATPTEIRTEVDLLLGDLLTRIKQLMFNSLLCAYYVGFIPILFTESFVHYDRWWSIELSFFIWANSFVILASHYLPPSYCHILHQCAIHLGCWARCTQNTPASKWSCDRKWALDAVVEWNMEYFKGEGLQNVAIPCDSSQECFYLLFSSRLHIHSWLLVMQGIIVTFEMVVLTRVTYWYQIVTMSALLIFNYLILHKLLYNRLMFSRLLKIHTD